MKRKIHNDKARRWQARRARTAKSVSTTDRPRLVVFRSSKHIYAQLVASAGGATLGAVSTRTKGVVAEGATGGVEAAKKVGQAIAKIAKDKKIEEVVFNRNGFLYHGRVKALADAAREAGLKF